jgi:low temperature requirement protein LtrA
MKPDNSSFKEVVHRLFWWPEFPLMIGAALLASGLSLLSAEEWHELKTTISGVLVGAGLRMLFDYFQSLASAPREDVSSEPKTSKPS